MKINVQFSKGSIENAHAVRAICAIGDEPDIQPAVAKWGGPQEKWSLLPIKWMPVGIATLQMPTPCVFTLGVDGTVGFGYGDYKEEQIDNTENGPKSRGPLRDLQVIGDHLYATGMGRQVYRRSADGQWSRIDEGVVLARGVIEVCGFNSIGGVSEDDIWAVGFLGEIWHYNGQGWTKKESGTKLSLHKVVAVQPDLAYCVGQKGHVLKYDGNNWQILHSDASIGDLWGSVWFNDTLYVASASGLYRLQNNNQLEAVRVNDVNSFGHLHTVDGVLWSFGTSQLASTTDGTTWNSISGFI